MYQFNYSSISGWHFSAEGPVIFGTTPAFIFSGLAFPYNERQRHYQGLEMSEWIFQDETHLSVIPYSLSRGMRIIYSRKPGSAN